MKNFKTVYNTARTIVAGGLLLTGASALAVENYGTGARAANFNCISSDCSGGGVSGGDAMFPPEVEGYQQLASTNSVSGSLGSATVTASLVDSGMGYTTMLQTGTASGATLGAANASGHTLEHYVYSGPATTLTITATLIGTVVGTFIVHLIGCESMQFQVFRCARIGRYARRLA